MKVVHCKREEYMHYIGRPSLLGNPYSHRVGTLAKFKVDTIEDAVIAFRRYAWRNAKVLAMISRLPKDAILGCWCKIKGDEPCHGDAIISIWKKLNE